MAEQLLEIKDLRIQFVHGTSTEIAVDGISFQLAAGETVGIVGESGSGKSVTALSIMGLLPTSKACAVSGAIRFKTQSGDWINALTDSAQLRGKAVAMIFQDPMTALNPVLTCEEQVCEQLRRHLNYTAEQARLESISLFKQVKLPEPETIGKKYPHQLSGGQKQRVLIAMAISCKPQLIIADEPTTALDVTVQATILDLLKELQALYGMSLLFISHDIGVIASITQRILVMHKGKLVEEGSTQQLLENPQQAYTKGLLACRPPLAYRLQRLPQLDDYLNEEGTVTPSKVYSNLALSLQEAKLAKAHYRLTVNEVSYAYPQKTNWLGSSKQDQDVVQQVSFTIKAGEIVGLVGESGCGKTTLGKLIMQLIRPKTGTISFNQIDLATLERAQLQMVRKKLQYIFQDPYASLNPRMKIGEALLEPLLVHRVVNNRKAGIARVLDLLKRVKLLPEHYDRYPHEFSGGQRQRIGIARALALEPELIICDEPVSALDSSVQAQVLNLLKELQEEFGFSALFITHDLSVVRFISDRILVMHEGQLVEEATNEALFSNPQHAYTKTLLAAIPA